MYWRVEFTHNFSFLVWFRHNKKMQNNHKFVVSIDLPKKLRRNMGKVIIDFNMIKERDRILLVLSKSIMQAMLTLNKKIIRQDCLYLFNDVAGASNVDLK